ncbi:unnamed protein product [Mytilus coruscus]|uniref:Endonuclease/exonuclease/phosphatase domain-containing protein n=1 Tax=Mytilus coruscus TaxID=42192 RepID=A0A6J8AMB2_MYTCO|nr:unnamed protein product [Mytilus coruscus]
MLLIIAGLETNPGPNDDLNSSGSNVNIADLSNFSELFSKSVSFLHLNIQSIVPELDLIEAEYDEFDILAFTESWLNNNNTDESIKLLNYHSPFRRDRGPQKTGGGVVVYVKNNLVAHRRQEIEMDNLESVWLELKLHENSLDMALNDNHVDYIMITGDFNDNQINCANSKIRPLLTQFSLNQLIDEPTHFTEQSSSLLDLFMTNNVNAVTYCGVGPPLLEQLSSILPVIPFNASTTINEIELNETEVEDILSIINPSKASGPDLINPKLLKEASAILKSPLCKLFNLSLRSAVFPHQWKRANVSPVFKSNKPNDVKNYRSISLLSVISKCMERCVYKHIYNH